MVELLVVVAVIGILLAILIPSLRAIAGTSKRTVELSAAKQLVLAYSSYSSDYDNALMTGYWSGLHAEDASGNPINIGPASARYPWRLAPYLDYDFDGLYLDPNLNEALSAETLSTYVLSLYPSLGLNSIFLGGDEELGQPYAATQGEFWLKRHSQARHPSDLLVFASARADQQMLPALPPLIEGHYRVVPPYITERVWAPEWSPAAAAGDWGFVSMRHDKTTAVVGLMDGSAATFNEGEIQDMRHWADRADSPNWTLP